MQSTTPHTWLEGYFNASPFNSGAAITRFQALRLISDAIATFMWLMVYHGQTCEVCCVRIRMQGEHQKRSKSKPLVSRGHLRLRLQGAMLQDISRQL